MMIYCKKENRLANIIQNQLYFMEGGHKFFPWGCSACEEWLTDFNEDCFEGDEDHIVITDEILAEIQKRAKEVSPPNQETQRIDVSDQYQ